LLPTRLLSPLRSWSFKCATIASRSRASLRGALSGSLIDYGINDDFVKKLGETIPVDSSALFVLVKSVTEDKVLAEIEHYRPRVLKTSLSNEDETKLKAALSKAA
jgi:uncharacterized membrane protein